MTDEEKIKKFKEIQEALWSSVINGDLLQSTFCAAFIRKFQIPGPNGESPEEA